MIGSPRAVAWSPCFSSSPPPPQFTMQMRLFARVTITWNGRSHSIGMRWVVWCGWYGSASARDGWLCGLPHLTLPYLACILQPPSEHRGHPISSLRRNGRCAVYHCCTISEPFSDDQRPSHQRWSGVLCAIGQPGAPQVRAREGTQPRIAADLANCWVPPDSNRHIVCSWVAATATATAMGATQRRAPARHAHRPSHTGPFERHNGKQQVCPSLPSALD